MRLLVTGGAGFIGSHIVELALEHGLEVAVLDDLSNGLLDNVPRDVPFYHTDLRDADGVHAVLNDFRPDVISHQAAQASVGNSIRDPLHDAQVNVSGTLHLLEASRRSGVRRVVFASTGGAIYGEVRPTRKATPHWPAQPESPYATSKLACEAYLATYARQYGLEHVILRYANVYGPRQNPHGEAGVIAIFCRSIREGAPLRIYAMNTLGDEGCIRDYVYVRDVARANVSAALGKPLPRILNVGTGRATTTKGLVRTMQRICRLDVRVDQQPPRAGDLQRSVLDALDFTTHFGPPTRLSVGLAETMRSFGVLPVARRTPAGAVLTPSLASD
ncbi:NAD-dependent epimerase/dehydratase family protein [Deinococcus pimensis]|uniref:NAD-dependent epimerase/dehydratase family protein n=1 Tax=Deinococcus pimensis TaxID=309888 RepID=UPI0004BA1E11|nr:NAD-dependent epimerase/dehydratase family protein [Deinococcus pimensis]